MKFIAVICLICSLSISGVSQSNPYDKYRNRRYSNRGYLSEEDELKLAEETHNEIVKITRLIEDPTINTYVVGVGQRLAQRSKRPNIPYHFYVVDDKSIDAFATLGGVIAQ